VFFSSSLAQASMIARTSFGLPQFGGFPGYQARKLSEGSVILARMDARFPTGDDDDVLVEHGEAMSVARYLERERQKQELRCERDAVVLAIARDLGENRLASCMGVAPRVIGRVIADADSRFNASSRSAEPAIRARRLGSGNHRWADADAHYEALGSGPQITARRGTPPQA
jgi:hypothetical protein